MDDMQKHLLQVLVRELVKPTYTFTLQAPKPNEQGVTLLLAKLDDVEPVLKKICRTNGWSSTFSEYATRTWQIDQYVNLVPSPDGDAPLVVFAFDASMNPMRVTRDDILATMHADKATAAEGSTLTNAKAARMYIHYVVGMLEASEDAGLVIDGITQPVEFTSLPLDVLFIEQSKVVSVAMLHEATMFALRMGNTGFEPSQLLSRWKAMGFVKYCTIEFGLLNEEKLNEISGDYFMFDVSKLDVPYPIPMENGNLDMELTLH